MQEALIIKCPGYGIPPKYLETVIGREAKKDMGKEDIITWEMV